MEELFLEPYEIGKPHSSIILSEVIENWPVEIQQIFEQRFPYLDNLPVEISFEKVDPSKFSAIGRINVILDEKKLTFPIIIRSRKLSPLDVFIINNHFMPATARRLESILRFGSSFSGLQVARPTDISTPLIKTYFPPVALAGVSVSKAAEKYTSLVERIAYNLSSREKEGLLKKLAELPDTITVKITEAAISRIVPGDFYPDLSPAINWDILQIRRDKNDYFLYIGSSDTHAPFKMKLTAEQLKNLLSAENYNKFFSNPAHYLNLKFPVYLKGTIKVFPATRQSDFILVSYPATVIATDGIAYLKGYTFPIASNFTSDCSAILFLTADGTYNIDIKIPAVPVGKNNFNLSSEYNLLPGDMFIFINPKNKTAIGPFTAINISRSNNLYIIDLADGYSIIIDNNWLDVGTSQPRYIVNECAKKITVAHYILRKLNKAVELSTVSPEISLLKAAVKKVDNRYSISGIDFNNTQINYKLLSKYAMPIDFDLSNLTEADLAFILAHYGATPGDIELIKKTAQRNGICYFTYNKEPKKLDIDNKYKQAFVLHKIAGNLRSLVTNDLLKAAALTEEPEVLDKLLALNVLTPETMVEFIDAIPEFERCLYKLSKLLIATRLGAQFDESALEKTIEGLDNIIEQLNILKIGLKSLSQ